MSGDPLAADAMGFLDEHLDKARSELAACVGRVDALRELSQLAAEQQAELRRAPSLKDLLTEWPTETDKARIRSLLERANKGESE